MPSLAMTSGVYVAVTVTVAVYTWNFVVRKKDFRLRACNGEGFRDRHDPPNGRPVPKGTTLSRKCILKIQSGTNNHKYAKHIKRM